MPSRAVVLAALVLPGALAGCARARAVTPPSGAGAVASAPATLSQAGIASWYGPGFHGKLTASGDVYNQNALTAAHRTLPLGTRVRVTNLANERTVEVRINDRGPFVGDRIIDLSRAAAVRLDMIGPGTASVRVDVLDTPVRIDAIPVAVAYTLQLGSFAGRTNADAFRARVATTYADARVSEVATRDGPRYRVHVGTFLTRDAADAERARAVRAGWPALIVEK